MIDSFEMLRGAIAADGTRAGFGLAAGAYGVVTLHRPSNVDDAETSSRSVGQLVAVARELPLVFPVHPRTRQKLEAFGLLEAAAGCPADANRSATRSS